MGVGTDTFLHAELGGCDLLLLASICETFGGFSIFLLLLLHTTVNIEHRGLLVEKPTIDQILSIVDGGVPRGAAQVLVGGFRLEMREERGSG